MAEQLEALHLSEPYWNGINAINKAEVGKALSLTEFSQTRDLLLVKFTPLVDTKPGPLENVILEDWATSEQSNSVRVLLVPKHKRSKTGPALLSCNAELQQLMEIYLRHIRPKFLAHDEIKHILVKNDGKPFKKRFMSFWQKTGLTGVSTSKTSLRKMYTTYTNRHMPEEVGKIQRVLCYGEKSSCNCYLRDNMTVEKASAVNVIKTVTSLFPYFLLTWP